MRVPLALALLALVLAAPASAALRGDGPPAYADGDYWETFLRFGPQELERRETFEGRESVVVNGTTYEAYKMTTRDRIYYVAEPGERTLRSEIRETSWYRASDGATVRVHRESRVQAAGGAGTTVTGTDYHEPCHRWQYPLEVGKAWESLCRGRTTNFDGSVEEVEQEEFWNVVSVTNVTTPAGAFEAFLVARPDNSTRVYWSPAACGNVVVEVDQTATAPSRAELTDFKCASGGAVSLGKPFASSGFRKSPAPGLAAAVAALGALALVLGRRAA